MSVNIEENNLQRDLKNLHISLGSLPGDTIKKLMCQKGKASSKVKVHYITISKVSLY